jgi:hypothetical protein
MRFTAPLRSNARGADSKKTRLFVAVLLLRLCLFLWENVYRAVA